MTFRLLDMVRMTAASAPGTGDFSIGGAATGFQTASAAGAIDGDTFPYGILDGANREEGIATYHSATTSFSRTVITFSTNSNAAINASASAIAYGTVRAQDILAPENKYENSFRNPVMEIAQRGTSGTVSAGSSSYTVDGWIGSPTGAALSWSQVFSGNLTGFALRLNCASGMTACDLKQRIVGLDALKWNTKYPIGVHQAITIQWTIYNNSGASVTLQVATGVASVANNFATVNSDLAATNLQTVANGAAGTLSYTYIPGAVQTGNGFEVKLVIGGALNHASGYIDVSFADCRATPGIATGLNYSPPTVGVRTISKELRLNQVWLYVIKSYYAYEWLGIGQFSTTTNAWINVELPTQMFASPGISFSLNTTFSVQSGGSSFSPSAMGFYSTSPQRLYLNATVTGATPGTPCWLLDSGGANAVITITCEL